MDSRLRDYATETQWRYMEAIEQHGSGRNAAIALGVSKSTINEARQLVLRKAAQHGYAPAEGLNHPTPLGFNVKGVSTLYDADGQQKAQWVKTTADDEARIKALHMAVAALSDDIPRAQPVNPPINVNADLCNLFVLTDYHVGMLAWRKEGGADWDLKIAEDTLDRVFRYTIAKAPDAETIVICQLGDFLHFDGLESVTPTSGHHLDADGRFEKVVGVAIRALRNVVDLALAKHQKVILINAEGNHDIASSVWLRQMFAALYENEPRVTVETSPHPYYAYRHGRAMLGFHHGHLRKMDNLQGVFAAQFAEMWGQTKYRYAHCGHLHHQRVKEDFGMTVTQHRTLAARDAYASRDGWFAERKASLTTYHKEFGEVGNIHLTPEMT